MSSFPNPSYRANEQYRLSLLENQEEDESTDEKKSNPTNVNVSITGNEIGSEKSGRQNDIISPIWKPKVPPPPSYPPLEQWRPFHQSFNFLVSTALTSLFYVCLPVSSALFILLGLCPRLLVKMILRFSTGGKFRLMPISRAFGCVDKNHHTAMLVCRGHCDIDKIRSRLMKAINTKDPATGLSKYNYLQQRVTTKYGYLCWENRSSKFDIKSHVKHFDVRGKHVAVDADGIIPYLESTYTEPFDNYLTAPQWEVLVIPKYTIRNKEEGLYLQNGKEEDENMYALVFRFHAGIMNWKMLQELLLDVLGKSTGRIQSIFCPGSKKLGFWQKLKAIVTCPLVGPQAFIRNILKGWTVFAGMNSVKNARKISLAATKPISLEALEDIRDRTLTETTTILGSCARICVRNMVLGQNMDFPKMIRVSRVFNSMSSLPGVDTWKTSFQKFRNGVERLHTSFHATEVRGDFLRGQRNFNKALITLLGFFPCGVSAWLYRTLMKADVVVEIWPGTEEPCVLFDGDVLEDVYGWSGVTGIDASELIQHNYFCRQFITVPLN